MEIKETTTTNEEKFKKALEEIAAGNAMDKYDLAIQIATKALQEDGE